MPAGSSRDIAFVSHNPGLGGIFSEADEFSVMDFAVTKHELLMLLQVIQINSVIHQA